METYKVKLPQQIQIGDPWYYEQFQGKKLDSLVVDINPPKDFETRVVLSDDGDTCFMQFCLAPKNFLKIYMQGKMLAYQQYDSKSIAVDTAKFRLAIDDHSDMVYTGGDGLWGECIEIYHGDSGKRVVDGYLITLDMPEFETMDDMRQRMNQLFENCELVEDVVTASESNNMTQSGQTM